MHEAYKWLIWNSSILGKGIFEGSAEESSDEGFPFHRRAGLDDLQVGGP